MEYQEKQNQRMEREVIRPETIRALAKRHMLDKNHTTTDEELRNAIVEIDLPVFETAGRSEKKKLRRAVK